jgi:uncharacterized membrane protein YwaF
VKDWHFNVLFFVGIGGAVILLFGPDMGMNVDSSPTAVTGVSAILTYVLTQKKVITRKDKDKDTKSKNPEEESDDEHG